jgi:hypothetical protein
MSAQVRLTAAMLVAAVASLVAGCDTTGYSYNPYRDQQHPRTQGENLGQLSANPYGVSIEAPRVHNTYGKRGYQHGWKVYEKPQPGSIYGGAEINPYGPGGSQSYGPGGGRSYGPGGGRSYGPGGGKSYGLGGGKNLMNPWRKAN